MLVSHEILFVTRNRAVMLQGKLIERVNSAKYLGIYLDCKLSWSEHNKDLCSELSKLSGIFYRMASSTTANMDGNYIMPI